MNLTIFQLKCREALEKLLLDKGLSAAFEVQGVDEKYMLARLANLGDRFEVYIYEDEAGFFSGEEWHPYERVDFDSDADLIGKLMHDIDQYLPSRRRILPRYR